MNDKLKTKANRARIKSLISIYKAKSGHPGGVLSSIDIILYLFNNEMNYDSTVLNNKNDRFILSKGHCAPALYSVGSDYGFVDQTRLDGLRKLGHELQGHTCRKTTPWVEASTGSLGQGFSFAIGEAKGFKILSIDTRVYVMIGDGELQEGEIWEGAMFSSHHKLNNLCAIVDYNKMQSDNLNKNIIELEPLLDKWRSFGWNVVEINGHDFNEIQFGFDNARSYNIGPTVIIANTIKGKGVTFMENIPSWHGSLKLSYDDLVEALIELGATKKEIEEIKIG